MSVPDSDDEPTDQEKREKALRSTLVIRLPDLRYEKD